MMGRHSRLVSVGVGSLRTAAARDLAGRFAEEEPRRRGPAALVCIAVIVAEAKRTAALSADGENFMLIQL